MNDRLRIGASVVGFSMYIWRLTKEGIQNIIESSDCRDFYVFLRINYSHKLD